MAREYTWTQGRGSGAVLFIVASAAAAFRSARGDMIANGSPRRVRAGSPITRKPRSDRAPLISVPGAPGLRALNVGDHVPPRRPTCSAWDQSVVLGFAVGCWLVLVAIR